MSIQPEQMLCPVLVGREDEMATLRVALDRAIQGHVRGVVVAGEAGVGKTRLCRALIKDARLRGLNPVIGLCSLHDTALPYGPIIDALRRALARDPERAAALEGSAAALAPLLPELAQGVAGAAGPPETSAGTPTALRRRLFEALVQALRAIASHGADGARRMEPLVLIVEDVHWADESTLDFLQFVLRATSGLDDGAPNGGMLVVATFRSEHWPAAPALARMLSALLATRIVWQVELQRLTRAQLARLLEATLGRAVESDVSEAFYQRSEGNPFVAEELLGALAAAGHLEGATGIGAEVATLHLPLSLRAAVLERFESLPGQARALLSAAAIMGRAFDVDLLARVTGLGATALLQGLRLALRSGLIEENPTEGGSATGTTGDRYRFRHALTRDVLYGELLAPERRTLHAAVAQALEERLPAGSLADAGGDSLEALAYHYRLAGDRVKAPLFAQRAAERDRALLAFAEARRHYADALSYLTDHDPARLPLLESLGLLSLALLDVHGAVGYIDEARTLLYAVGLTRKAAVVLGEMHHLLWYADLARFRAMVEELDAVAEAAHSGADGAGPEDADALATYAAAALAHAVYAHYARANVWAARALHLAATLDHSDSGAAAASSTYKASSSTYKASSSTYKALLARGHARVHGHLQDDAAPGGRDIVDAGLRDLYETLDFGLRHALPEVVQLTYNFLPRGLLEAGRDAEAVALIDAADDYARRSGVAAIADMRGYSLLHCGRWDEGVTVMRDAVAQSRAIGAPAKLALELTALGHLLVSQGQATEAAAVLEEALAILEPSGQFVTVGPCLSGLAQARSLLADEAAAAALFARGHALWRSTQDRSTVVPLLLEGCLFHATCGDALRAQEWAEDLARVAGDDPPPIAAAAAAQARGVAFAAAGQYAAAQEPLRQAVERWDGLGHPYAAARARMNLGAAILAAASRRPAHRAEADALLVQAAATFQQLGARPDAQMVEDLRRRGGLLAQARRRRSLAQQRAPFGDLTPREREVLILLAAGRTNREIAQALFIAEGTAELHVSHILGKLGCVTRAQAAAYAVAHRLVETG